MPVTMKQIAQASRVSQPTVSLVLNNKGQRYSEATRKAVLEAAQALGYRPNSYAQSMRSGRFHSIALVQGVEHNLSTIIEPLLGGIQDALQARDLSLTLTRLADEKLTHDKFIPKILRKLMADGMLIDYIAAIPSRMVQLLHETKIPAVWMNSKQQSDCVHPDDLSAGRKATEHLLELGHRRIAFVRYGSGTDGNLHYSLFDRVAGYEGAMKAAGLSPQVIWGRQRVPIDERIERSLDWLGGPERPTAVVADHLHVGVAVLYAASTLGLRPGKELSLVAISDTVKDETGLFMDRYCVPLREMGIAAVEMLMRKIAAPAEPLPPQVIPFIVKSGSTCGPVKPAR